MNTRNLQDEIIRIKKEKNICILAHAYQSEDILEVADFVGDSFALSQKAKETESDFIVMCGVRFMAETVKILSPQKRVFLANKTAGCPMADQMDKDIISELKKEMSDYTLVCYINTTLSLKTICDVCVTSSSAVKIIKNIKNDKILFVPDCNLGDWVSKQVPEKEFSFVMGGCPTHLRITKRDVEKAKSLYPNAKILVHPECHKSVVEMADFVGSTTEIMDYAINSEDKEFVIGTENSITQHLQFKCLDKKFYPLSKDCVCHNMCATNLIDVYNTITGAECEEIIVDEEERLLAKKCIDKMLELNKD